MCIRDRPPKGRHAGVATRAKFARLRVLADQPQGLLVDDRVVVEVEDCRDGPSLALREDDPGPDGRPDHARPAGAGRRAETSPIASWASAGRIRRAARARWLTACFRAGDHSPTVAPPGGSPCGSKIGS